MRLIMKKLKTFFNVFVRFLRNKLTNKNALSQPLKKMNMRFFERKLKRSKTH